MKGCGKITVELFWDDNNYGCRFMRGRHFEDWQDLTADEQKRAIGAMITMAELFGKFLKTENESNKEATK